MEIKDLEVFFKVVDEDEILIMVNREFECFLEVLEFVLKVFVVFEEFEVVFKF